MSAGYYKKTYERFENFKDSVSESKTASSSTTFRSVFNMLLLSNRKARKEAENSESSKKRSIKSVIKDHQNTINNFIMPNRSYQSIEKGL